MVFVISGPSAVGKTVVTQSVLSSAFGREHRLETTKSCTTREPRGTADDDASYDFMTDSEFDRLLHDDEFIEHTESHGHMYGTRSYDIIRKLDAGINIVRVLDRNGGMAIRRLFPDRSVLIYMLPPNDDALAERMSKRGHMTEDDAKRRLSDASREMDPEGYDYVVVNDDIDDTVGEIEGIISDELSEHSSGASRDAQPLAE